jgi:branched-chain amino acid transport system substrate-binding protein
MPITTKSKKTVSWLLASALAALSSHAAAEDKPVIKIGVIQALQGECSSFGAPIIDGFNIWADAINKKGGVQLADGKTYNLEPHAYDNVCYIPGEELKAARRAVNDGVQILLQTYTPASRQAIADLVTKNEVLTVSYGAGYLSPDYPYLMGTMTGAPAAYGALAAHIAETKPELTKFAIITTDASFGQAAAAWYRAALAPYKDRVQIVYDASFSSASDMLGLITPLMETKPDVILELGFSHAQKAEMVALTSQLGFKGVWGSEFWVRSFLTDRVEWKDVAGRLYGTTLVEASEPTFSPRAHEELYKAYVAKYGEAAWSAIVSFGYDPMVMLEPAFEKATAPTGKAIREALLSLPNPVHPLFGKSEWGGEELFGINQHLYTPVPMYNIDANGEFQLETTVDFAAWWKMNRDAMMPVLKASGQVYRK